MRLFSSAVVIPVALFLIPICSRATPVLDRSPALLHSSLHSRDDDHAHIPNGPMAVLNESQILEWHLPTPPSYWSIDIDGEQPGPARYPALIALHAVFFSLAFFVALPAGIALRSSKPAWHGVTTIAFYSLIVLGCASSRLYRKLTPDMYEGSTHSTLGYIVLLLCLSLSAVDIAAFFIRLYTFFRGNSKFTFKNFWRTVVLGKQESYGSPSEYSGLVADDPEEFDDMKPADLHAHGQSHSAVSDRTVFDAGSPTHSRHSEDTLHDVAFTPLSRPREVLLRRIAKGAFATLERSLVFIAFAMLVSGVVIYTGGCRDSYINGCLAHLIKGGIFWCYGLFTFARYLGSHAELGWAWNLSPIGNTVSGEFVESLVIFLYGITNTWMERFGAKPGDPYSTKQVQHISIAVMFWFAGLVGMGIESRRVRRWLAASTASLGPAQSANISEPPSYKASFNPFPALVIGVTGAAMSAHAQAYVFQVQIHVLWGGLLLGFSVLRCLTYFFLWLGPPSSVLPSRPPTEALGSFFLACGGLMFMFSTEELTVAAMRRGRDDVMMFLNVAVAITCFAFCWTLVIVTFNGWLKSRKTAA